MTFTDLIASDPALSRNFAAQFDAVPKSQWIASERRIAKLEGAIRAFLDEENQTNSISYHAGSEELLSLRNTLRRLVDWEE